MRKKRAMGHATCGTLERMWQCLHQIGTIILAVAFVTVGSAYADDSNSTPSSKAESSRLIGRPKALSEFFKAIYTLEKTRQGRVSILQIGDSHTASNHFSGTLRKLLQDRFGNAGPGGFPPGQSYKGLYSPDVEMNPQTWTVSGGLEAKPGDILGISGFCATSSRANNEIRFKSKSESLFTSLDLTIVGKPNGGSLIVDVDGKFFRSISTKRQLEQGVVIKVPLGLAARLITVKPKGDGSVDVLRVSLHGASTGIFYESYGVVGASINLIQKWHEPTVAGEIEDLHPALIILEFGTNDSFNSDLSEESYRTAFRERLATVRRWAPWASILVVGPPDANRLPKECSPEATHICTQAQPENGSCSWFPPVKLAAVREIERSESVAAGAAFWDWNLVMGGACGTHAWTRLDPTLATQDHKHFRPEGYRRAARLLFDDLMGLYSSSHVLGIPASVPQGPPLLPGCRSTDHLNGAIRCQR